MAGASTARNTGLRAPWKPGESGNPAGRPKRHAELLALAASNMPAATALLEKLLNGNDLDRAYQAAQFVYLYALGKPMEATQLAHLESMRARATELVIQPNVTVDAGQVGAFAPTLPATTPPSAESHPAEQPDTVSPTEPDSGNLPEWGAPIPPAQAVAEAAAGGTVVEVVPASLLTQPRENQLPPVLAGELALTTPVLEETKAHFLQCVYRTKEGRCEDAATPGGTWCETHRAKLFSLMPERD